MRPENKEKVIFFINQGLELQSLGAYRYDPRVDFDNDQKPENLLGIGNKVDLAAAVFMRNMDSFLSGPDNCSYIRTRLMLVDGKRTKSLVGH